MNVSKKPYLTLRAMESRRRKEKKLKGIVSEVLEGGLSITRLSTKNLCNELDMCRTSYFKFGFNKIVATKMKEEMEKEEEKNGGEKEV